MRPVLAAGLLLLTACGSVVEPVVRCEPVIVVTLLPVDGQMVMQFSHMPCPLPPT